MAEAPKVADPDSANVDTICSTLAQIGTNVRHQFWSSQLAEHVGCPTMSRLLCWNRICAKSLLLGSFGLVPLLARVDGFDQDKAESKRDERAIILPAAARERK
jgi:hypothetical protein